MKIVIFGRHNRTWMNAFRPHSSIWSQDHVKITQIINLKTLKNYLKQHHHSIVIPLMERHSKLINQLQTKYHFQTLIPSNDIIDCWSNKQLFANWVEKYQLTQHCPRIYSTLDKITNDMYPIIIKPNNLNNGRQVIILNHEQDQLQFVSHQPIEPYIIQSYIDQPCEYTTHCLCLEGQIIETITYCYIFNQSRYVCSSMNPPISREAVALNINVLDVFKRFVKIGNYNGICNIDYKLRNNFTPVIFEINPRFGGSLMLKQNRPHLQQMIHNLLKIIQKNKNN